MRDEKVRVDKRGFLWWWEGLEESELRWQETRGRDGTVLSPLPSGLQHCCRLIWDFPFYVPYSACSSVGKESACSAGDPGSIPGLGRSPGEGNGNPLQYPCLKNLMDRGLQSMGSQTVGHDWTTNTYILTSALQVSHQNCYWKLSLIQDIYLQDGVDHSCFKILSQFWMCFGTWYRTSLTSYIAIW